MKKLVVLVVAFLMVLGLSTVQAETYLLKVGTSLSENDPIAVGLAEFEKIVEEKTNGDIAVEVYPSSQLGADEDLIEQATMGMGIGLITDAGRLGTYVKEYGIIGGPYLVDDYEEALKLLETSAYGEMVDDLADVGLRVLSGNWYAGSRDLYMKSKVTKPEDLKGLRVRSSGSDIVNSSIAAMGADPTVTPWSEAYSALQQKVVDGVEANASACVGASIYEVSQYLCRTGHFQHILSLVVSESWYKSLPEEYQTILADAAKDSGLVASEMTIAKDAEYEQLMVENGMEVVEVDIEAFKEATKNVYEELGLGELKAQIDQALGKN